MTEGAACSNWAAEQAGDTLVHARLVAAEGAVVWYSSAVHTAQSRHARSVVAVGAENWKVLAGQAAVTAQQTRSALADGVVHSYCAL